MKKYIFVFYCVLLVSLTSFSQIGSRKPIMIETNAGVDGEKIEIQFNKGKSFKDPTFAFWVEDVGGNFIETLYVTQYLATGIFRHARLAEGRPLSRPGEAKRPSSLPVWLHKRNDGSPLLPSPSNPMPDAITSATPKNDFILNANCTNELPDKFIVYLEINQPFDYNQHWTKEIFPGEFDYSYSAQPALVYAAEVDMRTKNKTYTFKLVGHSHYSGRNGKIYSDVSTITTASDIVQSVTLKFSSKDKPNL